MLLLKAEVLSDVKLSFGSFRRLKRSKYLRNIGKYLPSDIAKQRRRFNSLHFMLLLPDGLPVPVAARSKA